MVDKTSTFVISVASFVGGYISMIQDGPDLTNLFFTALGLFGIFIVYSELRQHPRGFSKDVRIFAVPVVYLFVLIGTILAWDSSAIGSGVSIGIQVVSGLALIIWVIWLEMVGYFKNNL